MIEIDKNYQYLSKIFLDLLTKNKEFKTKFQAFAPEIYADIESAATNPNCSCRAKIESFVNKDKENLSNFLNSFIKEFKIEINISEIENQYGFQMYSGKVEKVKISDWQNFTQELQNKRAAYRSFSVLPIDEEYVKVFFI